VRFYKLIILLYLIKNNSFRMARTKLPKDIKKRTEEWKFSSGALMMSLVAYSDGKNVKIFR
jgi:hypothetical protein